MTQLRLYLAAAVLVAGLGLTVYVQRLKAEFAAISVTLKGAQVANEILGRKIKTDAAIQAADNARADAAEASLHKFKEKADAELAKLREPSRLCFGRDDTRRVQRLFER